MVKDNISGYKSGDISLQGGNTPWYQETANGTPFLTFDNLTAGGSRNWTNRQIDLTVDVDDEETDVHETIADQNIIIEMWIRPYANNVITTGSAYGMFTLADSTGTSFYAADHGLRVNGYQIGGNKGSKFALLQPYAGLTQGIGVNVSGDTVTSSAISTKEYINGDATEDINDNVTDGQWIHFALARYIDDTTVRQRTYINGEFIGTCNITGVSFKYENLKYNDSYLNFNKIVLGKGYGNLAKSFSGDIASCNIYSGYNWSSVSAIKTDVDNLYANSSLKTLNSAPHTVNVTLTDGSTETITASNVASAEEVNVSAVINDFCEIEASNTTTANYGSITALNPKSVVPLAFVAGYDSEGSLICVNTLNAALTDYRYRKTTLTGTLTVPSGKTLNDVRVFAWRSDMRPITTAYCLR